MPLSSYIVSSIIDNLRRRYGAIAPPIGTYLDTETEEYWESKGLDWYEIGSWLDMGEVYGEESQEATEELAWIYFLILKRQYYGISPVEERMLRTLIADFLQSIRTALYKWLVVHGQIDDFETFRDVMMQSYWTNPEAWEDVIREKQRELEEEIGEEAYYLTVEDILEEIINEEWERRRSSLSAWLGPEAVGVGAIIAKAEDLMNKIDVALQTYETYPLGELIILLDAAVDFEHQHGKLLEDIYFFVNVPLAKKLAEIKFNEFSYAKFIGAQ